jgi:hypothetical protein
MPELPIPSASGAAPETPEALYDRLRVSDADVVNLWSHQADALRDYYSKHVADADVAIELPTGAGKTLVGLLIAEWRRQKLGHRVAFVCPVNLLAGQVAEKARGYGIEVVELTGSHKTWKPADVTAYRTARQIAITNYNHIFSEPSYVADAQTLVLDDAHSGEDPVAAHWSARVERERYPLLYAAILDAVADGLSAGVVEKLRDGGLDPRERSEVHLLPVPTLRERAQLVLEALEEHTNYPDEAFFAKWVLREAMPRCLLYVAWREILIRPFIPPTRGHAAFADAAQRLYMSATLGSGGELERAFGVTSIRRIPVPPAWRKHGAGRRLFLMPGAHMDEPDDLIRTAAEMAGRLVLIAPSGPAAQEAADALLPAEMTRVDAAAVEKHGVAAFTAPPSSALVMANRYDGLDLPNGKCRMIVLSGLPAGTHAQERFLWERLGARRVLSERVRTRISQGSGRATRNRHDFAAVLIRGRELIDFMLRSEERVALRPELQAELDLGVYYTTLAEVDYLEVLDSFLKQADPADDRWAPSEDYVRTKAEQLDRQETSDTEKLENSARDEIHAWWSAWRGDLADALAKAQEVVKQLSGEALRPYRAFWSYLAAEWAAELASGGAGEGVNRAAALREGASRDARGLSWSPPWLGEPVPAMAEATERSLRAVAHLEGLKLGSARPEREFREVLELLAERDASPFEQGLERLGLLLGFESVRPAAQQAAPDAAWRDDDRCWVVWEAKSEEDAANPVNVNDDVRKANTHQTWMKNYGWTPQPAAALTVIVSARTVIHEAAAKVAGDEVTLLQPAAVGELAERAVAAHRAVRARAAGLGSQELAEALAGEFVRHGVETPALLGMLGARRVKDG